MEYRKLGRTNLNVSVIGVGGGAFNKPISNKTVKDIIDYAFSNGVNFIDAAEDYDETKLPPKLKEIYPKLVLSSKSTSHNKETMLASIKNSIKRLKTDTLDIYQLHTVTTPEELKLKIKAGVLDALQEEQRKGTIKFIGITSHRTDTLIEAIKTQKFDVIEASYSIGQWETERLFPIAKKYGIGIIAMRVFGGGILIDREKQSRGSEFMTVENALRFALSNKSISTMIIGISSLEHLKENIEAFKKPYIFSEKEKKELLQKVIGFLGKNFCRGCKTCMPCDANGWAFDIDTYLRMETFYSKYGYKKYKEEYKSLSIKADKCTNCGACEKRCPYKVPIRDLLKRLHEY